MKFGGSSLEDWSAFERVSRIVSSYDRFCSVVVVVSAMSSMTQDLLSSVQLSSSGDCRKAIELLEAQRRRHLALTFELPPREAVSTQSFIQNSWCELLRLLQAVSANRCANEQLMDAIISYGEILSAKLLKATLQAECLPAEYVDARRCVITNQSHGHAKPFPKLTRKRIRAEIIPLLESGKIPVLGGFIGGSRRGVTTTLGRGASDYTATLVGAAIDAREIQIWTDVDGILTADPNVVQTTRSVPYLSYAEAAELSRFGAKVLHPKSIEPASKQNVPLRVFNSRSPELPGTLVCGTRKRFRESGIKAIAFKTSLTLINLSPKPTFVARDLHSSLEKVFREHDSTVDLLDRSDTMVVLALEQRDTLPIIIGKLERLGSVETRCDRALICCVADGWLESDYWMGAVVTLDAEVRWRRRSSVSLIADVPQSGARTLVQSLHHRLFDKQFVSEWCNYEGIPVSSNFT